MVDFFNYRNNKANAQSTLYILFSFYFYIVVKQYLLFNALQIYCIIYKYSMIIIKPKHLQNVCIKKKS